MPDYLEALPCEIQKQRVAAILARPPHSRMSTLAVLVD
jgi:hypothetical protein